MQTTTNSKLVPIQSVGGVDRRDLAGMVALAVDATAAARMRANQVFATARADDGEEPSTIVSMTVLFNGPIRAEERLAELIGLLLRRAARAGAFVGSYAFEVSAEARDPVWNPKGAAPLGFADRVWDWRYQIAA